MPAASPPATAAATGGVELRHSPGFARWLREANGSLAFTTYQSNRLFLVGVDGEERLAAHERLFDRPMGIAVDGSRLWLATRHQLWRLEGERSPLHPRHDRVYAPREVRFTGEIDAHDVAVDAARRPIFACTLLSCVASLDPSGIATLWRPPFVSRLVPEDRCHLNGLATVDGRLACVTAVSRSDVAQGWRDRREDGGVVLAVPGGEPLATGLSMPHSPRFGDGRLWLLSSGTGELGTVEDGRFAPLAFLPGYARGLALVGGFAVVGLSKPRHETFRGLPLDDALARRDAKPRCGLWIIDLASGARAHWLELEGAVSELYDVAFLPGVRRPMALGLRGDEIDREVSLATADGEVEVRSLAEEDEAPAHRATPAPRYAVHRVVEARPDRLLHAYEGLTFPDLAQRARLRPLAERPLAVAALAADGPVALAVAEPRRDDPATCDLLSLFVRPGHRRRRLATRLLAEIAAAARERGATRLEATYRTSWRSRTAIESLLAAGGWSPPVTRMFLGRGSRETLTALPLPAAAPLPEGLEIFPWDELPAPERARILAAEERDPWYPAVLTPFQEEAWLEPRVSVGLRRGDEVVGWLLAHRVGDETLQYTTLAVHPELRRTGAGLALIAAALRRRVETDYRFGIFAVDARNTRMVDLVERNLRNRLLTWSELRVVTRELGGEGQAGKVG